jgi:hypothetical protein
MDLGVGTAQALKVFGGVLIVMCAPTLYSENEFSFSGCYKG